MRLVGILCWYDEQPGWLAACVASLAKAEVEHVVAVDGAFALYPNGRPTSPVHQRDAIVATCHGAGIGCTLHVPFDVWAGNEVEKRTFAFRLAEQLTDENDWYFVMDADQVVTSALGLRSALEDTGLDVGEVRFHDSGQNALSGYPVRCLFRALRGLKLVDNHYTYVLPDGRMLWGQSEAQDIRFLARRGNPEPAIDLSFVQVEHRSTERSIQRRQLQLDYYERRDRLAAERPLGVAV